MSLLSPAERSAKETAIREQGIALEQQRQAQIAELQNQLQALPKEGRALLGYKEQKTGLQAYSTNHQPVYARTDIVPDLDEPGTAYTKEAYAKAQDISAKLAGLGVKQDVSQYQPPDIKSSDYFRGQQNNVTVDYAGTLAARQAGLDVGSGLSSGLSASQQKDEDARLAAMNPNYRGPSATRYDPFKPVESGGLFDINTKAPKVAGYNPANQRGYNPITGTVTPQRPRKTVQSNQPGKLYGNVPTPVYDEIDAGLTPKPPVGASVKSAVSPIAFTPLRGSNVTARTYQSVKNLPATTENLLGVVGSQPPRKTFTTPVGGNATKAIEAQLKYSASIQNQPKGIGGFNLLPSAFAETPQSNIDYSGIQNTLNQIKQSGGRQVTIVSPSGKKTTLPIDQALNAIKAKPEQGSYGFEYLPALTPQQRTAKIQNLKGNQQKIIDIINEAKSTGAKEITIIETGGKRSTVPLSRAFYDITKSSKTSPELSFEYGGISSQEKTASISAAQKSAVTQINDFTKQAKADFADTVTIKSEDGKVQTVPLAQAQLEIRRATAGGKKVELSYQPLPKPITLTDAAKEVERITGLGGIASPGLAYIDRALQLDLPYQQRSKQTRQIEGIPKDILAGISNYEIGASFAPVANFGAEVYDFTRAGLKQAKGQVTSPEFLQGLSKGRLPEAGKIYSPQFTSPPPGKEFENILGLPVPKQKTPQQATSLGDIFAGKPISVTSSETQASLAGEAALQTGFYFLFKGAGNTGESLFGRAGKIKEPNVKLKVIESYEIPDVMRKPPGEGMRPLSDLYKETVKLRTPEQMTVKQMKEANIATNVLKARTEELFGKGASRYAGRYNPQTGKIGAEYIGFDLGSGRGFIPGGEGGIGTGPGDLGGLPPGGIRNLKLDINAGRLDKAGSIKPDFDESMAIGSEEPYTGLGEANPKIQTTSLGPIGGVGDVFRLQGKEIVPIPKTGALSIYEKLRAFRRHPELEERQLYKFYPKGSGKFGNPPVEPIDLTGRFLAPEPMNLRMVRLGEGRGFTVSQRIGGRLAQKYNILPDFDESMAIGATSRKGKKTIPKIDFKSLTVGLLKLPKTKTVKPKVNFPTVRVNVLGESKPSKREGKQPRLKLLEKNAIENQVDKILKLDINAGRLEKGGGIKTIKLDIPKTAKKTKTKFTNIYQSHPEGFPPLYEPQNAKLIRKPGIGKAILEGRPVNINPRALPPSTLVNRVRVRQPLINVPRVDIGTATRIIRLPKPRTDTKVDTGLTILTVPKTGQPTKTGTITGTTHDFPQKRKTRTGLLNIPDQPQELITELRFPQEPPPQRNRFGFFLPPGGRGGGGYGRGKRTRKTFYTNPSDPLRAGVILTQGVPELISRSPKIFKQVDVLLAKSRKRNKYAGLDQPPVGVNIKSNFLKNINIKI